MNATYSLDWLMVLLAVLNVIQAVLILFLIRALLAAERRRITTYETVCLARYRRSHSRRSADRFDTGPR
jgi:hypothetical protein